LTSDLIEYRYIEQGSARVFALVDGDYHERTSEGHGEQPTTG
jgi:hypothetical protein